MDHERRARARPHEGGVAMRSKWTSKVAVRYAVSASTITALVAIVGAGFKWG